MPAEMEECKNNGIEFIELPIAYDGLTVVVHPKNDWVDYMTVSELRKLWSPEAEGKITKWNQIRPEWPDQEIHLYGAGTASGTFDYFTEAIVGEAKKSRGDYTSSEDDNVLVQGISTDPYALGYFGLAYYEANQEKLKVVPIDDEDSTNGSGAILPTYDNIVSGLYQPLSRPLFIYVNRKALEKPHVKQFVQFYLDHAAKLAKETGYVSLPDTAYKLAKERVEQLKTGSVFFNAKPGMKIETLLQKEAIQ
jgi:phosphate transport system substrate-binding protein